MSLFKKAAFAVSLAALTGPAFVQAGGLDEQQITTLDQFCGTSGWHDATEEAAATIYIEFPEGNGPAQLLPMCLVLRPEQVVNFEVAGGRTAEIIFPGRSAFDTNVLRVGGLQKSDRAVTLSARCPLSKDVFGCKYDVAEADNAHREVLDPIIIIKGGGGTGQ